MIDNTVLDKYLNNETKDYFVNYNLDSITKLLLLLDTPHKKYPCIHIAGTNGKGTTSWVLAEIFQKSGYKTGLYTSPHLAYLNERIRINRKEIPDQDFNMILKKIETILNMEPGIKPTYFDILTVVAFQYFEYKKVDIAIIETGLGGRMDSTNVIDPILSIITDISFDHVAILGDTIEKISFEKSGIIKHSRPVITSNDSETVINIISEAAKRNSSEVICLNKDFLYDNIRISLPGILFNYKYRHYSFNDLFIPLLPGHQVKNCSLAITAALYLGECQFKKINNEIIIDAINNISIPGRYEVLCDNPLIIFDPAHNYSGLKNLFEHIESCYNSANLVVIITLMKDKAVPELLELIKKRSYIKIYLKSNDPRSYQPSDNSFDIVCNDDSLILQRYIADKKDMIYFFTGTFRNYKTAVRIAKEMSNTPDY